MKRNFNLLAMLLLAVIATTARAEVTSKLAVQSVYDDNIYRLQSGEVDAWITKIKPMVLLEAGQGEGSYGLQMDAEAGIYSQSKLGDDDYTDYRVLGMGDWQFDVRNQLGIDIYHTRGHDDRGTGRMDVVGKLAATPGGDFDEPDTWVENGVGTEYVFGAPSARGAITFSVGYSDKNYDNNEPSTDQNDVADTEMRLLGLLKVMPRTSLLLESRWKGIDYKEDATNRDSEDIRYFVGAQWEATAKTTGSIRLGYQEKDPDDTSAFDSFNATAWEADVVWAPRTYSTIQLTGFRGAEDSSDALNYVDYETYSILWKHKWSSQLTTAIFGELETEDYEGSTREDDTASWGFSASYRVVNHVSLNGEYRYADRDSSIDGLDYDRNQVVFSADVTFE